MSAGLDVGKCRAKDPSKCPYHGGLVRMSEAARAGDVEGFLDAKATVGNSKDSRTFENQFGAHSVEIINQLGSNVRFLTQAQIAALNKGFDENDAFNEMSNASSHIDNLTVTEDGVVVYWEDQDDGWESSLFEVTIQPNGDTSSKNIMGV